MSSSQKQFSATFPDDFIKRVNLALNEVKRGSTRAPECKDTYITNNVAQKSRCNMTRRHGALMTVIFENRGISTFRVIKIEGKTVVNKPVLFLQTS